MDASRRKLERVARISEATKETAALAGSSRSSKTIKGATTEVEVRYFFVCVASLLTYCDTKMTS